GRLSAAGRSARRRPRGRRDTSTRAAANAAPRRIALSSGTGPSRPHHGGTAPRSNFQLARVFGIRIGVGISWFVILFVFIFAVTGPFHEMLGGSRTTAYLVAVASVLSC